jgi:hypothetical protein
MAVVQLHCDSLSTAWDLGHAVFPQIYAWETTTFFSSITDIWIISSYVLFLVYCFWSHPAIVKRRFVFCLTVVYALRIFSLLATRYPILPGIVNQRYEAPSVFGSAFLLMVGIRTTQTDYMFSGHTSVWTMTTLFVWYYTSHRWTVGLFYALFNLTGVFLLLAIRMHYSADVWIAFVISTLVFMVYHLALHVPKSPTWERIIK